jgi:hypothetical protein
VTGYAGLEAVAPRGSMMDESRDVVVVSGVRIPIGRYGGSLKDAAIFERM